MVIVLINAVEIFARVLVSLLVVRAVMSWFVRNPYSTAGKIYSVLIRLTEPFVSPCRRLLERLGLVGGMFDFSVLLAFFLIEFVEALVVRLLMLLV